MPMRGMLTTASCRRVRHNGPVSRGRVPWVPAGILAGLAGLATSYAAAVVSNWNASATVELGL
jgi:hypothetical protein